MRMDRSGTVVFAESQDARYELLGSHARSAKLPPMTHARKIMTFCFSAPSLPARLCAVEGSFCFVLAPLCSTAQVT